jgi:hypothetical protein
MNAARRLWRALGDDDWRSVVAQFHAGATIDWPVAGARVDRDEYAASMRERLGGEAVEVRRSVSDGRFVAVEASVGETRCCGFYDLHDGRISNATEYWVGDR